MRVLVLGSHGTIGTSVSKAFLKRGDEVIPWDIKLSVDHDLRVSGCLDSILPTINFVVFLAFDVGGAKYMVDSTEYIDGNLLILHNTFASLKKFSCRFIHSTSTMSNMNHNAYAVLKRVGELYTTALGGINLKLWNVYGSEPIGIKSHVIPDLIDQAVSGNSIHLRTDGSEKRMFLHADDFSRGLIAVFENYEELRCYEVIDISAVEWTSILDVAKIIQSVTMTTLGKNISIIPSTSANDSHNKQNQPDMTILSKYWKPTITLEDGITSMFPVVV